MNTTLTKKTIKELEPKTVEEMYIKICNDLEVPLSQTDVLEYLNEAQSMIAKTTRRNVFKLKNLSDISVLPPICHQVMEIWLGYRVACRVNHIMQTEYFYAWMELLFNLAALIDVEDGVTANMVLQMIKDVRVKQQHEDRENDFVRDVCRA